MEACHFWENSPTGITAFPVALDNDVMLLRQPFLIGFWDAEKTRWVFFFCWSVWRSQQRGDTAHRLLPQQVRHWKNHIRQPCKHKHVNHQKTPSILQPQSCKTMCTTVVIQDYNNHYARDNVILDSCWKQIWMFLLAWKIRHKKGAIYI